MGQIAKYDADSSVLKSICDRSGDFLNHHGRRPRLLVTMMGQQGYDRGFAAAASSFAKFGFDVDISPVLHMSSEAAKIAIENDVHVVGVTILSKDNLEMVSKITRDLRNMGGGDIIVAAIGIILPGDSEILFNSGVKALFATGTSYTYVADKVLTLIEKNNG